MKKGTQNTRHDDKKIVQNSLFAREARYHNGIWYCVTAGVS